MGYTLAPPEGFALLKEAERSKSWTPGGQPVPADEGRLVLTRSSKVYLADDNVRRLGPEQMIRGLQGFSNIVVLDTTAVTIDGMPGYESRAKAVGSASGAPVRIYCAAVFAGDGTFYVVGHDAGDDAAENADRFRSAAQTLVVK
jgi:hypothetical protein